MTLRIVCNLVLCCAVLVVFGHNLLLAQDNNEVAGAGTEGIPAADVNLKLRVLTLGDQTPLSKVNLYVLVKTSRLLDRRFCTSNDQGVIDLHVPGDALVHCFGTGSYEVPRGFAQVKLQGRDLSHDLQLRSTTPVKVHGTISVEKGKKPSRAYVYASPLDVRPGGNLLSVDAPFQVMVGEGGTYAMSLPQGYYHIWGRWSDMQDDNYQVYFGQQREVLLVKDTAVDLVLKPGPEIRGLMIDASTGQKIGGSLRLYTDEYMVQKGIYAGDGSALTDDPIGEFRTKLGTIDPENFTVIAKDGNRSNALTILSGMSVERLNALPFISIRDPAQGRLDVQFVTSDLQLPVEPLSVSIAPSGPVAAPSAVREELELLDITTGNNGKVTFWGLPKGRYSVYTNSNILMKEFEITDTLQELRVEVPMPFITGRVVYPDGSECTQARYRLHFLTPEGEEGYPQAGDLFANAALKPTKRFMLPLVGPGLRNAVLVGAPAPGGDIPWSAGAAGLPYISDEIVIESSAAKGYEMTIQLKPNPEFKATAVNDDEDSPDSGDDRIQPGR